MATITNHESGRKTGPKLAKAGGTKAEKTKEPKPARTALERLASRVGRIGRMAEKAATQVRSWNGQGDSVQRAHIADAGTALARMVADAKALSGYATQLQGSGFQPQKRAKAPRPAVSADIQIWVRPAKRPEYELAFGPSALAELFVDKLVGTKALCRIGAAPSGGQVARLAGFIPVKDITTVQPA